jgi:hypothetical protein
MQRKSASVAALTMLLLSVIVMPIEARVVSAGWNSLGTAAIVNPKVEVIASGANYIDVRWEFSGFNVQSFPSNYGEFSRISIQEWENSRSGPGEPNLPISVKMIALPDNTVGKVEVIHTEWIPFENVRISPRQIPTRDGSVPSGPVIFDPDAYNDSVTLPEELSGVTTPQGWGGIAVAGLWVSPVRYTPASQQMDVASSMLVRVWFEHSPGNTPRKSSHPSRWLQEAQRSSLLNPPPDPPEVDDADEPDPVRMLVVLRDHAFAASEPFIDLHKSIGLRTEVWTIDDDVDSSMIKDRIAELYEGGLEYVLMIGDGYENRNVDPPQLPMVPMAFWDTPYPGRRLDPPTGSGSDGWYVCMDGDDRDGFDDHVPDLAISRLVYNTPNDLNQLQAQIAKISDYIAWTFQQQNGDWLARSLLVAHRAADRDFLANIRTIVEAEYDFTHPQWIPLYGNQQEATNNRIIERINQGVGFFIYRGHGDNTRGADWNLNNEDITANLVGRMNNRQMPFIMVSSACENGNIYDYPGNCLLEAFQKRAQGASVSAHGSAITTFTEGNSFFTIATHNAWFDAGIYSIGYATNRAVAEMIAEFDAQGRNGYPGIGRINARAYLWLGDASIQYKLETPASLSIDAPLMIPVGTRTIDVTIRSDGEPFQDAIVTAFTDQEGMFYSGRTNAEGQVRLMFDEPVQANEGLEVSAWHREAQLSRTNILVANGMGVIRGRVLSLADSTPVEASRVHLNRFNVRIDTDRDGSFFLEGIPSGQYQLTASAPGMIPQSRNIDVVERDTLDTVYYLSFSDLRLDSDRLTGRLHSGASMAGSITIQNPGNGRLEWNATFTPASVNEPFSRQIEFFPGWDNHDSRINGVVFTNDRFYIAGSHSNADPNYIYVFDRDGWEIEDERMEQPTGGFGLCDLDYDGEFLYGAPDNRIFAMNLQGEVVDTIPGPHNLNLALAAAPNGEFWVGLNRSRLIRIDRDGNVLQTINVNIYIQGLTWYAEAADGFNLLAWGYPTDYGLYLYGINPATGIIRPLRNLAEGESEMVTDGLFATLEYNPLEWTVFGMASDGEAEILRGWSLGPRWGWFQLDPSEGVLEPEGEAAIDFRFNAEDIPDDSLVFRGNTHFTTNSEDLVVDLPIELTIEPLAVSDRADSGHPTGFALSRIYPNPFNSTLSIVTAIPEAGPVSFKLIDLQGRTVYSSRLDFVQAGELRTQINAERLANGVYMVRAESKGRIATAKAVLLK